MEPKIAIIGGGAAGMMCAATIVESIPELNYEIHIFDKNPKLGIKVAITGGGRCNVTTGDNNLPRVLSKYTRGANFLKASLAAFTPQQVQEWFIQHNVPLKTEKDNRVFPVSNKGTDIVKVFEDLFAQNSRVQLHLLESVIQVTRPSDSSNDFQLTTEKSVYEFNYLVITTGGNAYQKTGSTGDGYAFAKQLGHSITNLGHSLNSFSTQEEWLHELSGISLPNVQLSANIPNIGKKVVNGPLLFTHFGISGPAVFALASHLAFEEASIEKPISIFLKPEAEESFESINRQILQYLASDPQQPISNIVSKFVPRRLAEKLLILANISTKSASELSAAERNRIITLLSGGLELKLTARRTGMEFVTAGGVELIQVNRQTMESKLSSKLFFAGEILDIDGLTGGYNLQAAWSTGRAAGKTIAKILQVPT